MFAAIRPGLTEPEGHFRSKTAVFGKKYDLAPKMAPKMALKNCLNNPLLDSIFQSLYL